MWYLITYGSSSSNRSVCMTRQNEMQTKWNLPLFPRSKCSRLTNDWRSGFLSRTFHKNLPLWKFSKSSLIHKAADQAKHKSIIPLRKCCALHACSFQGKRKRKDATRERRVSRLRRQTWLSMKMRRGSETSFSIVLGRFVKVQLQRTLKVVNKRRPFLGRVQIRSEVAKSRPAQTNHQLSEHLTQWLH